MRYLFLLNPAAGKQDCTVQLIPQIRAAAARAGWSAADYTIHTTEYAGHARELARAARNGYQLTHTPRVGAVLAARARSPYGARELRRQVDRAVEQALANQIASGTAHTGQHWTADCTVDGEVTLMEESTLSVKA